MRKILFPVVSVLLLVAAGCTPPKPQAMDKVCVALQTTATSATEFGFNVLDKKNHAAAVKTAQQVSQAVNEVVLPYLNGEAVEVTSFAVNQMLQEKFFSKLDDTIQTVIIAAAAVLDSYVSPPDPTQKMTKEELDCLKAFFQGVADGTKNFTVKPGAVVRQPAKAKGKWFR